MATETSAETIGRILSVYSVGEKIRRLRLRKKLGLKELGEHTGLSASMLSQLETGKLIPTLPTLARIAMVFDVGVEHFFEKRSRTAIHVVRAKERIRFPDSPDNPEPAFFFESLAYPATGKPIQAYLAEFPSRKPRDEIGHVHEGAEFVFVVEGELDIRFGQEEVRLAAGDSVYFDATEPHTYRGVARAGAKALVVTVSPPKG